MVDLKVSDFYDQFSEFQQKIAYNERHFLMLDKLLELGLHEDSSVLELGCGIGVISSLILRVVSNGSVIAADISPKSIEIARRNNPNPNAEFFTADITEFDPQTRQFDFVTLFDVLEHVPSERHPALFTRLVNFMSEDSKLVINIPSPEYVQHVRETAPSLLQIIDQSIALEDIVLHSTNAGLRLKYFETYDLWHKDESQFMYFELRRTYKAEKTTPPTQTIIRRLQNKLHRYW